VLNIHITDRELAKKNIAEVISVSDPSISEL
jgi:predicted XRE-type DNA-binding protein